MSRRFLKPSSLPPTPGYSKGVTVSGGHTTWTAAQVAFDSDGNVVGEGDIVAQTRQTFVNLGAVLQEAGATFADVVKLNAPAAPGIFRLRPRARDANSATLCRDVSWCQTRDTKT
ncbi:MAG: RidA family protein [Gaiellaceae bacterium]